MHPGVGRVSGPHLGGVVAAVDVEDDLEGRLPNQQLIAEHPQTPQIDLLIICLPFHHLRGQVVQ